MRDNVGDEHLDRRFFSSLRASRQPCAGSGTVPIFRLPAHRTACISLHQTSCLQDNAHLIPPIAAKLRPATCIERWSSAETYEFHGSATSTIAQRTGAAEGAISSRSMILCHTPHAVVARRWNLEHPRRVHDMPDRGAACADYSNVRRFVTSARNQRTALSPTDMSSADASRLRRKIGAHGVTIESGHLRRATGRARCRWKATCFHIPTAPSMQHASKSPDCPQMSRVCDALARCSQNLER
ncbi:hypothetical protein BKA63DRAFT_190638 [Paraphoma chrysanthemicola]|nr:hypothetical protein BKA63DRAFT_190638 [Paraphoma chrysanthemicola]